jgi:hypothetical protein
MATRVLKPRLEREDEAPAPAAGRAGPGFTARLVVVAAAAAVALALWRASDVLLMAFGGLLLAVTLSAFADLLARRTPLGRRFALPVAVLAILAGLALLVWSVGGTLASQFNELLRQLPAALAKLRDWFAAAGVGRAVLDSFGSVYSTGRCLLLGAAMFWRRRERVARVGIYSRGPRPCWRGFLRSCRRASARCRHPRRPRRARVARRSARLDAVVAFSGLGLARLDVP